MLDGKYFSICHFCFKKLNNCYACCQMIALLLLAFLSLWSVCFLLKWWAFPFSLMDFVFNLCRVLTLFFFLMQLCDALKKKKSFTNSIYSILVVFLFLTLFTEFYFWHTGSSLLWGLFSSCGSGGCCLVAMPRHCGGFSCFRSRALGRSGLGSWGICA